jgi:hypothetical protein
MDVPMTAVGGATFMRHRNGNVFVAAAPVGDCQNTRAEGLIAESEVAISYTSSSHRTVKAARCYPCHDGRTSTLASDVDIDHAVALKEAQDSDT